MGWHFYEMCGVVIYHRTELKDRCSHVTRSRATTLQLSRNTWDAGDLIIILYLRS